MRNACRSNITESKNPYTNAEFRPLSAATKRQRRKSKTQHGQEMKPLLDTGMLRQNITNQYDKHGAAVGITRAVKYGRKHQYGRGVPKRVFMGINKSKQDKLQRITTDFIEDALDD